MNQYVLQQKVISSCKPKLELVQQQMKSNKEQFSKIISQHFDQVIGNIQKIKNKVINALMEYTSSLLAINQSDWEEISQNNIHNIYEIILKYFEVDQNNETSFVDEFKAYLEIPKIIQEIIITFNDLLIKFLKDIQINTTYKPSIYAQQPLPYPYIQPPSPDPIAPPSKTTINIMNQQNAQGVHTKNFSFVLKSKQTFNLEGLKFGEGSDNEQISIIIKDGEGQEILNEERIIGGTNMQIIFKKPIKFQENKEYTIQISKKFEIKLMIYKVKQQNDYVEVLSDSTPIDALLI